MGKQMITIIADEDVINELACYPYHRVWWVSDPEDVPDEIVEIIDNSKLEYDKKLARYAIDELRSVANALEAELEEEE